jgi:hypothetical protein
MSSWGAWFNWNWELEASRGLGKSHALPQGFPGAEFRRAIDIVRYRQENVIKVLIKPD